MACADIFQKRLITKTKKRQKAIEKIQTIISFKIGNLNFKKRPKNKYKRKVRK